MIDALYIHIPFCDHICTYCDFPKLLSSCANHEAYLNALKSEISSLEIENGSLKTIYIGGGTPSSLHILEIMDLFSLIDTISDGVEEFTFEANPESLTEEKIAFLSRHGVNRVSLGVQSYSDEVIKQLGRHHTIQQVRDCVALLKKYGITEINLDFIYGLPSMTMEGTDKDIDFALSLHPTHLSFYSLQIEEGTTLYLNHVQGADDVLMADMYEHIVSRLHDLGYERYEVSNFAIPGHESKHNLTYWHDHQYYGCGLGAASYMDKFRITNTKSLTYYLQGNRVQAIDNLSVTDEEFEYLMLNLRLISGFSLDDFYERFHRDFLVCYQKEITRVADYTEVKDGCFRIRPEFLYTMDNILLNLEKEI